MIFYTEDLDNVIFRNAWHLDRQWCLILPSDGNSYLCFTRRGWWTTTSDIEKVVPMGFASAKAVCRKYNADIEGESFPKAAICCYDTVLAIEAENDRLSPASATQPSKGGGSARDSLMRKIHTSLGVLRSSVAASGSEGI